ncbi:hypothetical protein VB716_14315 [Synechococcus sp. CCY9201]|uniref:hypothetical protein n=1 Tax=Synechococcus sp. CCY9201 TaxID=174697 RepID=UPI002B1FC075|nr:hypothetical protein [Synechococcus sp. CCY9201]MEA5475392.1 hypothetical protein [Synechococcus sp. CCY9201]
MKLSTSPLGRELPLLIVEIALLVVLLHANAPEVWFWFAVLLLLLLWRFLAWQTRRIQRSRAPQGPQEPVDSPAAAAGSTSGSDTGAPG